MAKQIKEKSILLYRLFYVIVPLSIFSKAEFIMLQLMFVIFTKLQRSKTSLFFKKAIKIRIICKI